MKKTILLLAACFTIVFSSCTSIQNSMREPNTRVNLEKKDFTFSDQVKGEATSVKILGIDFKRLFLKKGGSVSKDGGAGFSLASIPVVGSVVVDQTASYALFDMMEKNPGFDVVFYPKFETTVKRPIGIGFFYKITEVKATARLAKIAE